MIKLSKVINLIPYLVVILLVVGIYYFIHETTKPELGLMDDSKTKEKIDAIEDTICYLRQELKYLQEKDSILQHEYDSLKKLPPIIKTQTIEKVKVINSSTDVNQLDSIIRTNW